MSELSPRSCFAGSIPVFATGPALILVGALMMVRIQGSPEIKHVAKNMQRNRCCKESSHFMS